MSEGVRLIRGDCLEVMATLDENSIDSVITDPPYGLNFMGQHWDHGVPGIAFWREARRVAKPGATLLAFGGTRTHHRLMCAIEDAGWETHNVIMWVCGSGFPKSHDISKAIDKAAGVEREVVGRGTSGPALKMAGENPRPWHETSKSDNGRIEFDITTPATPSAELWDGWGTALKPAWEPIVVAMKPRDGTFAANALKWGVAGLNIDGGRVGMEGESPSGSGKPSSGSALAAMGPGSSSGGNGGNVTPAAGRWPANLIHDGSDEVTALFPVTGKSTASMRGRRSGSIYGGGKGPSGPDTLRGHNDSGSAARFFYCAKASRTERDAGCEGMKKRNAQSTGWSGDSMPLRQDGTERKMPRAANNHPTVKPLALMRYLAKLTKTPTGGVVLDPFMGSGTTGMAAVMEGRAFIGIEIDVGYFEIATARIQHAIDERNRPQQGRLEMIPTTASEAVGR